MLKGVSALFLTLPLLANSNPFVQKLPFDEAIIEYTLSGNTKGVKTLYIKNHGVDRVIYQNIDSKLMNKSSNQKNFIIMSKRWEYQVSQDRTKALRTPSLSYLLDVQYKQLTNKEQKQVRKNLKLIKFIPIQNQKFKIIKNFTKIQNLSCDMLISGSKKECYGYNGSLILKSTTKVMGFKKDEIVSNIFKTKVDSKLFDISNLDVKDDKEQSLKLYKLSRDIVDILKSKLNQNKIFIKNSQSKKDYSQIIQDGIKELDKI